MGKGPTIGLSLNAVPPFGSGHSYRYQGGAWNHDTEYDDMIRAYVDPLGTSAPVGGFIESVNKVALFATRNSEEDLSVVPLLRDRYTPFVQFVPNGFNTEANAQV